MKRLSLFFLIIFLSTGALFAQNGKVVFETYCWGCHHQTAVAFGPPFSEIASKRNEATIRAMITDPKSISKVLGYSRNAMPAFTLNEEELKAITSYILSYKETNNTKETK